MPKSNDRIKCTNCKHERKLHSLVLKPKAIKGKPIEGCWACETCDLDRRTKEMDEATTPEGMMEAFM